MKRVELKSTAYHLGDHISITSAIADLDFSVSKTEQEFALFEVGNNSWIYLKNYGSIVFINVNDDIRQKTLMLFLERAEEIDKLPSDDFVLVVDRDELIRADFGTIYIPEISLDVAHVIALNMAQTVALDDFQCRIEALLETTRNMSNELYRSGNIKSSRSKVRKLIGETMVLKNRIAENMYIFDSPDVIWDDKVLTNLDSQMHADLEFQRRHQGLQLNLDTVKENLDNFQSILQHKHSSILEWIIILLILLEVIQLIIERL